MAYSIPSLAETRARRLRFFQIGEVLLMAYSIPSLAETRARRLRFF